VAIQSGQLKQLITQKIIPPASDACKPETLKAALTFTKSLGYEEASVELNLMWEESKARQALLDLCNSDPLYKPIIRYMVSGLQEPAVIAQLTPKASKLRLSEMVSQVGKAIAYFSYEPKSVTLARLCKRGVK